MAFIKLNEVIKDKVGRSQGLKRQMESSNTVESAQKFLDEKFGAGKANVLSFRDEKLRVSTTSSIVATELKMQEKSIVDAMSNGNKNIRINKLIIILH